MKNTNEDRDAARAVIEEAIDLASEAEVFCDACAKRIDTGHRPVDFCSNCHSVLRLWLASMIEAECARMNAEQPGRFTITKEGETTFVKRNWFDVWHLLTESRIQFFMDSLARIFG
jgi:hypothetical protein